MLFNHKNNKYSKEESLLIELYLDNPGFKNGRKQQELPTF